MKVSCPSCSRVLEYSGDRPVFCAYCGQPLADPHLIATGLFRAEPVEPSSAARANLGGETEIVAGVATRTDGGGSDAETVVGSGNRSFGREGPSAEPDPARVAGYRIVKLLGQGGMGSVYEAEDVNVGRRVALKLIAADHVASPEAVERFRQEGRLASTIAHPRCVFVLAADEERGRPYIVMELMPGETLQTLADARGPLPMEEAIGKILDVIEGLREAHLQGVIHRDVKPSNCFLEADGRVKVGDFGLSKSLDSDAGLTRTGAFVGTPLYASPEQIKRDMVDERTDVYSVAATLYFLLTGKPPFQASDAAATLAKIVSEPPPTLRTHRPDLPAALDAAVLRGLERDRDRRWPDLLRLRNALLPFVSSRLRLADLALRVSAYLADFLLLLAAHAVFLSVLVASAPTGVTEAVKMVIYGRFTPLNLGVRLAAFVLYFGILEGFLGTTLGKQLTGLRVSRVPGGGPPGVWWAPARASIFYALTNFPGGVFTGLLFGLVPAREAVIYEPLSLAADLLGCLVMAATMRAANGYRGLHEWVSGTRVVRLVQTGRRRPPRGRRLPTRPERYREASARPVGVLTSLGPFRVRGAVRWDGDRRVLLGEDSALERPVWIVLRSKGAAAPPQVRRDLGRTTRPRWLSGGEQAEGRWDAYTAPMGCPLADLAGPRGLPWADARPVLHELADELAKTCADGTLPENMSVDQVWVQLDGSALLVDPIEPPASRAVPGKRPDQERALDLVRKTTALALEGGRRRGGEATPAAIKAAVPVHAARMLDRLLGRPRLGDTAYAEVAPLVADLEADREKPTEVDVPRRAAHLAPASLMLTPLLVFSYFVSLPSGRIAVGPNAWALTALAPILWVVWAALTRGGLLLGLAGIALVRTDSRPAERWRCAWRALVAWAPVVALLAGACFARARVRPPAVPVLAWMLWGLALAIVASYPVLALVFPARSVHDRLAGTYLVPK